MCLFSFLARKRRKRGLVFSLSTSCRSWIREGGGGARSLKTDWFLGVSYSEVWALKNFMYSRGIFVKKARPESMSSVNLSDKEGSEKRSICD